jgi:hypothetical protein
MTMDPLERSKKVKQEAEFILKELRVFEILGECGTVQPGGSYFLDVLVYPDIDLYITNASIHQLFWAAEQFASHPWVSQVIFEKSDDPTLPGGVYIKPLIVYGDWGRPWKIDIWSLDAALIEGKMVEMRRFKEKMDDEARTHIITYKCYILNNKHRTPMYSGYFIYKAFLDEGLTDFDAVTRYLIDQGIHFD